MAISRTTTALSCLSATDAGGGHRRVPDGRRWPIDGPGERLPQLQHLQRRLQAAHAQERHRLDARRGILTDVNEKTK